MILFYLAVGLCGIVQGQVWMACAAAQDPGLTLADMCTDRPPRAPQAENQPNFDLMFVGYIRGSREQQSIILYPGRL